MFKKIEETIYIFSGYAYLSEEDASDAIADYILETYPEIVHSDFIAQESGEFEDLWHDVETMPLIRWVKVDE